MIRNVDHHSLTFDFGAFTLRLLKGQLCTLQKTCKLILEMRGKAHRVPVRHKCACKSQSFVIMSRVSSCQILLRYVCPLLRYSDLTVFNMADIRHVGFVIRVFGPPTKSILLAFVTVNI